MKRPTRCTARWALLLAALSSGTAFSGELRLAPYIEYRVDNNSNLFSRARKVKSDTSTRASIGLLLDWPVSNQRLTLEADASTVRFNRFDRLDHSEHDALGAWEFDFGHAVHGKLSYRDERYLDDFENRTGTRADLINRRQPQLETYVDINPSWRVHARAGRLDIDHSLDTSQRFDRRENQGELALQYRGLPESAFGVGAELIDGYFPERTADDPLAPRFEQPTAFLEADWKYSGVSRVRTRFGYTERKNSGAVDGDSAGDRDFSGLTGRLGYQRTLSGKTKIYSEIFRQIYSVDNVDASYVQQTGASLEASWRYGPKLNLETGIRHSQLDYRTLAGGDSRQDRVNELSAQAIYQPNPAFALIANAGFLERDSNQDQAAYNAVVGSLALRLTLGQVPQ